MPIYAPATLAGKRQSRSIPCGLYQLDAGALIAVEGSIDAAPDVPPGTPDQRLLWRNIEGGPAALSSSAVIQPQNTPPLRLHLDHTGVLGAFPNARHVVQRDALTDDQVVTVAGGKLWASLWRRAGQAGAP